MSKLKNRFWTSKKFEVLSFVIIVVPTIHSGFPRKIILPVLGGGWFRPRKFRGGVLSSRHGSHGCQSKKESISLLYRMDTHPNVDLVLSLHRSHGHLHIIRHHQGLCRAILCWPQPDGVWETNQIPTTWSSKSFRWVVRMGSRRQWGLRDLL